MKTCQIKELKKEFIPEIRCNNVAIVNDSKGLCILHSEKDDKNNDEFMDAVESKMTNKDYDFRWVVFPISFNYFANKNFSHRVYFSFAKLFNIEFNGAVFLEGANFSNAEFKGDIDFSYSKFYAKTNFNHIKWSGSANFFGAELFGEIIFDSVNIDSDNIPVRLNLSYIRLDNDNLLNFQNFPLAHVIFYDLDLRRIKLHNVTWQKLWGRDVIYDEILLYKKEDPTNLLSYFTQSQDYARVERLYRRLKINYEIEKDYTRVGDFHYGEMEMHRQGSPWWRRWFSWYPLYWALSGYGERPLRAFIWLLLLIPAWAGLVWGLGIDRAGSQTPVNYGDTLLFIFEKATLQRPELPKGITWLGKFLSSLSVLLLPGQAALFILALRNRLGRRR